MQTEGLCALHIIQKGQVRITFDAELMSNSNVYSFNYASQNEDNAAQSGNEISVTKKEGSYFGEWALLGEHIGFLRAVAEGDVVCAILTKEKFESVVGPLPKLSQDDQKYNAFAFELYWHSFYIFFLESYYSLYKLFTPVGRRNILQTLSITLLKLWIFQPFQKLSSLIW